MSGSTRQAVSINKARQLTGLSRRAMYDWIAKGKVEYVRTAGGSIRIFVDTLLKDWEKERELVGIMSACALVSVSRRTIYNWINSGKVQFIRTASGSIRIYKDSLLRNPDGTQHLSPPQAEVQA